MKFLHQFSVVTLSLLGINFFSYAEIKSFGVPYVQNYSKDLFNAGNQNWAISKDKYGVMYFGNTEGLLKFDGNYWHLYKMPNAQIVRAVASAPNGRIYVGGFAEFGYWNIKNNKLNYTSLTSLLPHKIQLNEEIWKIYLDGNRVLFQSFSKIYIYDKGVITVIGDNNILLFLHQVGKKFWVEQLNKGLFELQQNKLTAIAGSDKLTTGILSIIPFTANKYLVCTSKNGLYIFDGKNLTSFKTPANSFLRNYQLNNGVKLRGNYYAFGTILNGIIIIDEKGNIVQRINKINGLQNNTVLSLYVDEEQNLWAGLDNGIDRIELNSPLYFYFDKAGKFGTVYSSRISDGNIYLGTNQGLFYSKWKPNELNFQLIPQSQGQVWELSLIDGQLLCGHNSGTFLVKGNSIEKISKEGGGWTIKKLKNNPNILIQGNYSGLAIFKKVNGNWLFSNRIEGFNQPIKYIEEDNNGDIWAAHTYKGLFKISIDAALKRVVKVKQFTEQLGLPSIFNVNIFNLENKIVFSSKKGFYLYDEIANRFFPYQPLNTKIGSFASANKIIPAGIKKYWFINHGKTALANFTEPGKIFIDSIKFNLLNGKMVQYYENISQISPSLYLISIDDGFAIYDASKPIITTTNKPSAVLLSSLKDITDKIYVISEIGSIATNIEIKHNRNNIRITFILPVYRHANIKYQYFLNGYSKEWSEWSTSTQKDFTNLDPGDYTFKVRAKMDDKILNNITSLKFTVLSPWYAGKLALFFYFILTITALIAGKRIYESKLKQDRKIMAKKFQQEQEQLRKKEAEEIEKQIIKLKADKLQSELAGKNRELANSAMNLVYKNELLQKLSNEIIKLKDQNGKRLPEEQTKKLQKVIDDGMNDQRDWNLFESSFNEAHESFFKKLKANHPDLVPNDLKLCAYLHMNMSSKEMAYLLNISLRGVEIRRYRLRKKLNIPHDKNLSEFLMEL